MMHLCPVLLQHFAQIHRSSEIYRWCNTIRRTNATDILQMQLSVNWCTACNRSIPGVAVILGSAPTVEEGALTLLRAIRHRVILVTLVGGIIDQCVRSWNEEVQTYVLSPLGKEVTAVIHVVSVALRAALIFGNVTPGDAGTPDEIHNGSCTGIR